MHIPIYIIVVHTLIIINKNTSVHTLSVPTLIDGVQLLVLGVQTTSPENKEKSTLYWLL